MSNIDPQFQQALDRLVERIVPGARAVAGLRRLSAGATLQTWSFDAVTSVESPSDGEVLHPLILRRSPGGLRSTESLSLEAEADLIRALAGTGSRVATVVHTLQPDDGLGDGFLMTRIDGETIPRKILRDAEFAAIRKQLPAQFGQILGAIHQVDTTTLPAALPRRPASVVIDRVIARYQKMATPRPVWDLALRWLRDNTPTEPASLHLVHGDFRNGNLIIGPEGVRAVLDWEVSHLGDPAEDLAWVCVPPWRFGQLDRPVGGLGSRQQLFDAYQQATGQPVDPARVRFWETLGSLRWAIGCAGMVDWFSSGRDATVERAMIARRVSESELDLMRILSGRE